MRLKLDENLGHGALNTRAFANRLWIIELGRIREYQTDDA